MRIERFGDATIGTELERKNAVGGRQIAPGHKNWNVTDRPDAPEMIEAIAPCELDVQEDQAPVRTVEQRPHLLDTVRGLGPAIAVGQKAEQLPCQRSIAVNNQDFAGTDGGEARGRLYRLSRRA